MERLFNLDPQLIHDSVLLILSMLVMFTFLSYLLFNPARAMLKKRQDKIQSEIDTAAMDMKDARKLKDDYDTRIKNIEREAEQIISEARKKALRNEERILDEAKQEAARVAARANAQIELERKKAADDMKTELIAIASLMAGKVVRLSVDPKVQDSLLEDTLKEIGEKTWQN